MSSLEEAVLLITKTKRVLLKNVGSALTNELKSTFILLNSLIAGITTAVEMLLFGFHKRS
jgi:hypothetical protein